MTGQGEGGMPSAGAQANDAQARGLLLLNHLRNHTAATMDAGICLALLEGEIDIDVADDWGGTALTHALWRAPEEVCLKILARHPDLAAAAKKDELLIASPVRRGQAQVVRLLLDRGLPYEHAPEKNLMPLDRVAQEAGRADIAAMLRAEKARRLDAALRATQEDMARRAAFRPPAFRRP